MATFLVMLVSMNLLSQLTAVAQPGPSKQDRGSPVSFNIKEIGVLKRIFTTQAGVDPEDEEAVAELLKAMRSPDRDERLSAIIAVGKYHETAEVAIPILAGLMKSTKDHEIGEAAAVALGMISWKSNKGLSILLDSFRNGDRVGRQRAVLGLGNVRYNHDLIRPALLAALRDQDNAIAANAARAFQDQPSLARPVLEELKRRLKEITGIERVELASAIYSVNMSPRDTVPSLILSLKEKDPKVGRRASEALSQVCSPWAATGRYEKECAPALDALSRALCDSSQEVKEGALDALADIHRGNVTSVEALRKILKDKDPDVRAKAARALGTSGIVATPAVPMLADLALGDPTGIVRLEASFALWKLKGHSPQWVTGLIAELLHNPDPEVRSSAAYKVGEIGNKDERVVPALKKALEDDDESVRGAAEVVLHWVELFK
jgi:HEAT repeat protein